MMALESVVRCVSRWMNIYMENHQRWPTAADADHSSLLRRLLDGKEPLPKPPPLSYSYPDYTMGEGEAVEIGEWVVTNPAEYKEYQAGLAGVARAGACEPDLYTIVINQHRGWRLLHKGLLEYKNGSLYRVFKRENKTCIQRIPDHV